MLIHLLRHGIAAEFGEGGVRRDEDRPLTNEGRAKMKVQAKAMRALGLKFDYIFTSPYLRTVQTARVVADEFKQEIVEIASLAPGRAFSRMPFPASRRAPNASEIRPSSGPPCAPRWG